MHRAATELATSAWNFPVWSVSVWSFQQTYCGFSWRRELEVELIMTPRTDDDQCQTPSSILGVQNLTMHFS